MNHQNKSGRRYGKGNRVAIFKRKSPNGKDDKTMLCMQSGADDHFIRDCQDSQKTTPVYFVLDGSLYFDGNANDLNITSIVYIFRKQTDELWLSVINYFWNETE